MKSIYFLLFSLVLLSCRTNPTTPETVVTLSPEESILFLDSLEAVQFIQQDPMEGFFEQITDLDMQIQLQKPYPSTTPRTQILSDYRDLLSRDVAAFTDKEQQLLSRTWRKAYRDCNSILPGLFPDTISLMKTLANHYGPGVYYTRGNGIVIPQNELYGDNEDTLYDVMLHELFHVWSRFHPEKRQQLYSLIGFRKLPIGTKALKMNDALRSRILLNPDGIDYSYTIQLVKKDGHLIDAIPIIISNRPEFSTEQPGFFSYLSFQLFPIEKTPSDQYQVISTEEGLAPENLIEGSNFLSIIKDNTGYIIHPDEIMADNFVLWVKQHRKEESIELSLSEEGQKLLDRIHAVLMD